MAILSFIHCRLVYDLIQLFQLSSEVCTNTLESLNSIDKKLLYIPKFQTITYGKQSLRYVGPSLWNQTFKTGIIQVDNEKENKCTDDGRNV